MTLYLPVPLPVWALETKNDSKAYHIVNHLPMLNKNNLQIRCLLQMLAPISLVAIIQL